MLQPATGLMINSWAASWKCTLFKANSAIFLRIHEVTVGFLCASCIQIKITSHSPSVNVSSLPCPGSQS